MSSDSGDFTWVRSGRWQAVRLESRAIRQTSQAAIARSRVIRDRTRRGRSRWEILHNSAYARLIARQQTMPVIEQAKGIVMAQQGCGPDEAFELLRRLSQRANVKVHDLAAQIVEQIAYGNERDNVTPLRPGQGLPGRRRFGAVSSRT